jgi:hypothetical protein
MSAATRMSPLTLAAASPPPPISSARYQWAEGFQEALCTSSLGSRRHLEQHAIDLEAEPLAVG